VLNPDENLTIYVLAGNKYNRLLKYLPTSSRTRDFYLIKMNECLQDALLPPVPSVPSVPPVPLTPLTPLNLPQTLFPTNHHRHHHHRQKNHQKNERPFS
jgi:hypothetical protein